MGVSGASLNGVPEEPPGRFIIVESDRFDADRDRAILSVYRAIGPERANDWAVGLSRVLSALPGFPGPLSHARDEEASAFYGRKVRRLLYYGPTRRRSGTPVCLLFSIVPLILPSRWKRPSRSSCYCACCTGDRSLQHDDHLE